LKYSFARHSKRDYLVVFGIYGAAMMLETVQLLREGGVQSIYMVGSMGARSLPVGTIVVPTAAEDKAGIVALDNPRAKQATPDRLMLNLTLRELRTRHLPFTRGLISSVPAVLHGIQHIEEHVKQAEGIIGHEMEGSTFLHFTKKHGIRAGMLLYVSDNDRHSIIAGAKGIRQARRKGLLSTAGVSVAVLAHF